MESISFTTYPSSTGVSGISSPVNESWATITFILPFAVDDSYSFPALYVGYVVSRIGD